MFAPNFEEGQGKVYLMLHIVLLLKGCSALHLAACQKTRAMVEALLSKLDVDVRSREVDVKSHHEVYQQRLYAKSKTSGLRLTQSPYFYLLSWKRCATGRHCTDVSCRQWLWKHCQLSVARRCSSQSKPCQQEGEPPNACAGLAR